MSNGEYLGSGSGITKGLWHLNGNSTDTSGNGNNGTDTSMTYSLANGRFNQGGVFSGSGYISIPSGGWVGNLTAFTIVAWFKRASDSASQAIYTNGTTASSIWCFLNLTSTGLVNFDSYDGNAGTRANLVSVTSGLGNGLWHNVVAVKSGASSRYLYVDGKLEASDLTHNPSLSFNNGYIGAYSVSGGGIASRFTGSIDEVIVENVAWSAEKVKKYYTYAKGRFGI